MDDLISRAWVLADIEYDIEHSGCVNHEREIIDCVRYAPSVDAVEVVHARWTRKDNSQNCKRIGDFEEWYECSACEGNAGDKSAYCPNCGARMDAEVLSKMETTTEEKDG